MTGLPLDLFTSGTARWLGVQPQLPSGGEQPCPLLVGASYALKAADTETLGGKRPSAFVTTDIVAPGLSSGTSPELSSNSAASHSGIGKAADLPNKPVLPQDEKNSKATNSTNITGSGTTNFVPLWTGSSTLGNSALFPSRGKVGNSTTSPTSALPVNGSSEILSTGSGACFKFGMRDGGTPTSVWYGTGNVSRSWRSEKDAIIGVTSAGNVGIGTTAPAATLEVNGTSKFDSTKWRNPPPSAASTSTPNSRARQRRRVSSGGAIPDDEEDERNESETGDAGG